MSYSMHPDVHGEIARREAKGLTQTEFAHRCLTTPSGTLKPRISIDSYLRWMLLAKDEMCDDYINEWTRERVIRMPIGALV